MMLVLVALSCPNVKMLNRTEYAWNQHDRETLAFAQKRCAQLYPEAPCLKVFRKRGKQDYSVLCGRKR